MNQVCSQIWVRFSHSLAIVRSKESRKRRLRKAHTLFSSQEIARNSLGQEGYSAIKLPLYKSFTLTDSDKAFYIGGKVSN